MTPDELRAALDKARDQMEEFFGLAVQLREYARHKSDCAVMLDGDPCDCGWDQVRDRLDRDDSRDDWTHPEEEHQPCEEKTDVRNGNTETT